MRNTPILFQNFEHPLYSQIETSKARGRFVVVDPMDPDGLLYLTRREYFELMKVQASVQDPLIILARPEDVITKGGKSDDDTPSASPSQGGSKPSSSTSLVGSVGPSKREYHTSAFQEARRNPLYSFSTLLDPTDFSVSKVTGRGATGRKLRHLIEDWGKTLSLRLGYGLSNPSITRDLHTVGLYFQKIWAHEGPSGAVTRMKVTVYCINSYIAGSPLQKTHHLGADVSLIHGLPALLPLAVRQKIRARDTKAIRLWVSVLSLYKGIGGYSTIPSFETITAPPSDLDFAPYQKFTGAFWQWLNPKYSLPRWADGKMLYLRTAGPNNALSILSAPFDAYAWETQRTNHLTRFLDATGMESIRSSYDQILASYLKEKEARLVLRSNLSPRVRKSVTETPILGRLSLKYEPAGKIRVFAIVDVFTQSALRPLHDWMFNLLSRLSVDATFTQETSTAQFASKFASESIYSFDLSSATDLIPFALTKSVFRWALGSWADLWGSLLVDRDFQIPDGTSKIRYTRGQPMGALSSWSSLAITHHWLVQQAAVRVGKFPFSDYLVLGDDICIAGSIVANSYVEVCKDLGVPINNKGIVSPRSEDRSSMVNFANQIICGETNLSPIQVREEIAVRSVSARCESLCRLIRRGVLDYHSPRFLPSAFRASVTSTHQLESGLDQFSRGLLPGGFDEVLTSLLRPTPDKVWSGYKEAPLSYIYLRHLAGLDILGGWVHYNKVPTLLSDKRISGVEMFDTFNQISQIIWKSSGRIVTDAMTFQNIVPDMSALSRLYQDVIKPDGRSNRQTAASYLVALPLIGEYLDSLKSKFNREWESTTYAGVVESHEKMIRFILSSGEVRFGDFLELLNSYLEALDAHYEYPTILSGENRITRRSWGDLTGKSNDRFRPHSANFREEIIFSRLLNGAGNDWLATHFSYDEWATPEEQTTAFNFRFLEGLSKTDRILGVAPRSARFLRSVLRNVPLRTALGLKIQV